MLQINKSLLGLIMLAYGSLNANALQLVHKGHDFFVETETKTLPIQRAFIDKELRGIDADKLSRLAAAGAYLKLNKMENSDDYMLRLGGRINGGGPLGATIGFWVGKILVHGGAQVAYQIASIATGPAYPVTLAALQAMGAVPVEAVSNAVGLGCGIIGAVATGPA